MIFSSTNGGTSGFINYILNRKLINIIEIITSSNYHEDGRYSDPLLSLSFSTNRWGSANLPNQWIQFNLPCYINIKNYTIVSATKMYSARGWKLTGSRNNHTEYVELDSIEYTEELFDFNHSIRTTNNNDEVFNSFRITMIGTTLTDKILRISGFDVFGRVYSFEYGCSVNCQKRCYCFKSLIYIFIFK